jgi:hypothetical protein
MRAITYAIVRKKREKKRSGGGTIADGKTDLSAFLRITDETTDAKSARGNDPSAEDYF